MSSWRCQTLQAFFLVIGLIVLAKLFYWQIVSGPKLQALAELQHISEREIPAKRGEIFASDDFPLVANKQAYLVFVLLNQLKIDKKTLAASLSVILNPEHAKETESELIDKLNQENVNWVPLAKKIDRETKDKIAGLKIEGLGFEESSLRFYPEASMSAQLLGFVGQDEAGRQRGYFGLEGYYERTLVGKVGFVKQERGAAGEPILIGQSQEESEIAGRDLRLSLDRGLQFMIENQLKKGMAKYQAKAGLAVVMDPKTGAVMAMSSFPNYDPDNFSQADNNLFSNPVISQTFEPGSVFKPIIMAAAINEQAITPEDRCQKCDGPRVIGDNTIKTWNEIYYPNSTMTEILEHSDNVGMVFVQEKLGNEKTIEYIKKFGFNELTGIDLEGEMLPPFRPPKDWVPIDYATTSFGQGVAVTPIQILRAIAAIANGGELVEPHVVAAIQTDKKAIETKPKIVRRVITPATAQLVTEMMVAAAEKGGRWDRPKGYRIAGKTGTAQIPIAGHYDKEKTVVSFVGFAPADNPRFVMLVTLKEPALTWGSMTVAPVWFEIAKNLFTYLKIPPSN